MDSLWALSLVESFSYNPSTFGQGMHAPTVVSRISVPGRFDCPKYLSPVSMYQRSGSSVLEACGRHTSSQRDPNRAPAPKQRMAQRQARKGALPTCARTASSLESPGCATQSQPWCYLEPILELLPYASPATQWSVSTSALRQLLSSINHHTNASP